MNLQHLRLCGMTGPKLASSIACIAILVVSSAASGGNRLFVGGLSWDTGGGVSRMKVRPLNDRIIVSRAQESGGATHAEAFVETAPGVGSLMLLPNPFGSTDGGADDVDCEESSGLCIASGSVENGSGDPQPTLWECTTSACTTWTVTLLPLPSGHSAGVALGVFIPQPGGLAIAAAVGWTSDLSGIAKATAWLPSVRGGFDAVLLPELGSVPIPPKESIALDYESITSTHAVVAGTASQDSGLSKPVVWYYDTALSTWGSPVELPLPVGSSVGAATALTVTDGTPGARVMTLAGVEEVDDDGTPGTRTLRLQCTTMASPSADCGSAGSWDVKSLPPLSGHGSSSALDIALLSNGYAMLAGSSYSSSTDPFDTGDATLWVVDSSTHMIVATLGVGELAYDLAAGEMARVLTSFRIGPGDGLGVHAVSGSTPGAGPRRWLMTEIPWNRRVEDIAIVSARAGSFDVQVDWRIDLGGRVIGDTELGATVDLEINGLPETSTDSEECLIWEVSDGSTYSCEDLPDGASCGTATLNTAPVGLTCDGDTGTCGVDFTTIFPGLSLQPGDTVKATLTPLLMAEAETVVDDDFLEVVDAVPVPSLGFGGLARLALLILVSGYLVVGITPQRSSCRDG
ncbi:MAG: hypothetical protein JRG89_16410 [Deltaproteobacteria bacterium]|nr:hypothetical protein [Deltaproteobacteria bacterium]MBW2389995.1 hypothetical protein [Deltaproteobacteria bacterium]